MLFASYSSCPPAYPTPASLPNILIKRKKEFGIDLESGNLYQHLEENDPKMLLKV
jgi:hypothetical protein